ncbi:MAG: HD domain-containing protein, partial [Deltaproteobacteria bacterium]|nr:HD domain-containing protein [Kofleriaceae bacterium]
MPTLRDRVFRDPVHGLIELRGDDRPIGELLETRALQRLRRIKQMGLAWLVYPGAEHSRFSHALGALHVAQRVTRQLKLDGRVALDVKVAALLHDVGHGPFSHAWEHVFPGSDHERWGARIVAEDPELHGALEALAPGLAETVRAFWHKTYRPAFARKLVSSQLDVDRLDYLLRDGHFSGAGYATYDLDWILHALAVEDVLPGADDPRDLVIDYRRGTYAVEQYLFARSYMYAQVYHHKTVRAAEWMLVKLFERYRALAASGAEPPGLEAAAILARGGELAVEGYLRLHDVA